LPLYLLCRRCGSIDPSLMTATAIMCYAALIISLVLTKIFLFTR